MDLKNIEKAIECQMKNFKNSKMVLHGFAGPMGSGPIFYGPYDRLVVCYVDDVNIVEFSYMFETIRLKINEHWPPNKVDDFLKKLLDRTEIKEAINSKQIKLHIENLLEDNSCYLWEYTEKDLKRFTDNNTKLLEVLKTLNDIGITVFGEYRNQEAGEIKHGDES